MEPNYPVIVQTCLVAIIPIAVYYFRLLLPQLPRVVVWALPMTLGGVLNSIVTYLQSGTLGIWEGVFLGSLGLVLRELISTLREHGTN